MAYVSSARRGEPCAGRSVSPPRRIVDSGVASIGGKSPVRVTGRNSHDRGVLRSSNEGRGNVACALQAVVPSAVPAPAGLRPGRRLLTGVWNRHSHLPGFVHPQRRLAGGTFRGASAACAGRWKQNGQTLPRALVRLLVRRSGRAVRCLREVEAAVDPCPKCSNEQRGQRSRPAGRPGAAHCRHPPSGQQLVGAASDGGFLLGPRRCTLAAIDSKSARPALIFCRPTTSGPRTASRP